MAVVAPSAAAFVAAYPHFAKAPGALVDSCLAQAARRTSAWLFKDSAAVTDLTLTDCRKVGPDVLLLIYRPANREPGTAGPAS